MRSICVNSCSIARGARQAMEGRIQPAIGPESGINSSEPEDDDGASNARSYSNPGQLLTIIPLSVVRQYCPVRDKRCIPLHSL